MLPYLLVSLQVFTMQQIPTGSRLHVRLVTPISSYESKAGDPVEAVLIAPVTSGGETLLPEGSMLSGVIGSVTRVGLGVVHETASLRLEFNEVKLPDGENVPISVRLDQVDNGREQVMRDGEVRGVRATASLSYRVSGYIRTALAWELHAHLVFWAVKTLIVQVPEPEIYYPAGVEMTLALKEPLVASAQPEQAPRSLSDDEHDALDPIVAEMPDRTYAPATNRPADLVNLMFVGSREEIASAFSAAGWIEAHPASLRSDIRGIQAVAEHRGYRAAPMSSLLLNRVEADMSWQKGFNDVSKRHHVRIWKLAQTLDGQELWAAAGTRDVDFAYMRPGQKLTHRIEADVDQERDKIENDLVYTGCVEAADMWERSGVPHVTWNATGDLMSTDTRLAIVRLNRCNSPRTQARVGEPIKEHGNPFQRILRRQILSARNDLLRGNVYWRGYEGTRWLVAAMKKQHPRTDETLAMEKHTKPSWSPFSRDRAGYLW